MKVNYRQLEHNILDIPYSGWYTHGWR